MSELSSDLARALLAEYQTIHRAMDDLASRLEDASIHAGGTSWQQSSVRVVDSANNACMYLQQIIAELERHT